MTAAVQKNKRFRTSYFTVEKKRRAIQYLFFNNKIFLHIRWQCFLSGVRLHFTSHKTKIKNFCFVTGKTRILLKNFRISRFLLKKTLSN